MKLSSFVSTKTDSKPKILYYAFCLFQILLGSIFLAITAQIAIPLPFTPVPITLQTLGVAILTMALGPRKGALAVVAYLCQASIGLPVLAGGVVNPLWMIGPRAGYLLSYIISSFLVGSLLETFKTNSFIKNWIILSVNEATVLLCGSLWLGFFVGWNHAFAMGALPFIPGAILKITIATSGFKQVRKLR